MEGYVHPQYCSTIHKIACSSYLHPNSVIGDYREPFELLWGLHWGLFGAPLGGCGILGTFGRALINPMKGILSTLRSPQEYLYLGSRARWPKTELCSPSIAIPSGSRVRKHEVWGVSILGNVTTMVLDHYLVIVWVLKPLGIGLCVPQENSRLAAQLLRRCFWAAGFGISKDRQMRSFLASFANFLHAACHTPLHNDAFSLKLCGGHRYAVMYFLN